MTVGNNGVGAIHKDALKQWTGMPAGMSEHEAVQVPLTDTNGNPLVGSNGDIRYGTAYILQNGSIDPNGVPQFNTELSQYNDVSSSRWLISNNYLCLKNINLTYDFPRQWVSAMKMQNLNLGVSIDNLFIATKMKGLNPQYGFGGGQGAYYVPSRVFSFQLTAKF